MRRIQWLAVFPILASTIALSFGPEPKIESGGCNAEFAKFLVDQQVAESGSVSETDKRVRILTRSADFLWKFDQPTARGYFAEAFKVATERFNEKGFEKKTDTGLTIYAPDYRFEVIRAIVRKDPEWAKRLTEQILKDYEKAAADRSEMDKTREASAIMQIAQESIKTNPDLSWYLFRRAMRQPLDVHWFFALYGIAGNDRSFADALYLELLRNYANETPRRLLFLSAYPFANPRILGIDKFSYGTSVPETLAPNNSLQQQFIDVFLRRIATFAADPANLTRPPDGYRHPEPLYMITALQDLEPMIVERFPAFIQRLSEARAHATGMLTDEIRKTQNEQEKYNESLGYSFEQRLKRVEDADEEGKLTDFMVVKLIIWGETTKTEDQFKQILPWLDKIKDDGVKAGTTSYFWFLRSKLAIKEIRLDEAQKFAARVPEIEHRSILYFEMAEAQLKNVNEASTVYQTLNDVGKLARQSENSVVKARILLGLANIYEKINHVFALDELSDAIKVINKLENPDMLSSSVRRQVSGKDFSFFASFQMPGYDLEGTFKLISTNDFEMSLSNAKALEDKYFRTLAVMALAQNCIDKPKPKPVGKKRAG